MVVLLVDGPSAGVFWSFVGVGRRAHSIPREKFQGGATRPILSPWALPEASGLSVLSFLSCLTPHALSLVLLPSPLAAPEAPAACVGPRESGRGGGREGDAGAHGRTKGLCSRL